jgi:superfamily II DNA or RNA helicase
MYNLRDYQQKFIAAIRGAYRNGSKAPLAVAPTGSGKTVVLSYIAASAAEKGQQTCILVHRQELISQTAITLTEGGIPHRICAPVGIIKNAIEAEREVTRRSCYDPDAKTVIASVQTLVHRMDEYPAFSFLMVDEAHHARAETWRKILNAYPASRLLGVTATPERLDGEGLGVNSGGYFDSLILGPTVGELINAGYLSRPRVFAPPSNLDLKGIKIIAGDYAKNELAQRVSKINIAGDVISHYRRLADGVPALAFCVTVAHARAVADEFRQAGYSAECLDGTMDDVTRRRLITDLAAGRLNVLASCEIISEGTDIPRVGAVIELRPTKSLGLYLQQVGRGLRPFPGKSETIILDHVGNTERHGFPDDEREWSLKGRKRSGRQREGNDSISLRQCLNCYAIYPIGVNICPQCGQAVPKSAMEIKQIDTELIEVARKEARHEQGKARTIEALTAIGEQRGYKNPYAWARYVHGGRKGA